MKRQRWSEKKVRKKYDNKEDKGIVSKENYGKKVKWADENEIGGY